jgi:cytochrome c7-like protein
MAQIFHPLTNSLSKASLFGAAAFAAGAVGLLGVVERSSWTTRRGFVREQPVPFSHDHHVGELGIDCRFCHASVETAAFAGMPATDVCMTCHSHVWRDSPLLEPVRASLANDRPLAWSRVYDLPDYAFFDHGVHVAKRIGCSTCHGRLDRMALASRETTLHMEWCLDCHRDPSRYVRSEEDVFRMDREAAGERPVRAEERSPQITDCSVCHR